MYRHGSAFNDIPAAWCGKERLMTFPAALCIPQLHALFILARLPGGGNESRSDPHFRARFDGIGAVTSRPSGRPTFTGTT